MVLTENGLFTVIRWGHDSPPSAPHSCWQTQPGDDPGGDVAPPAVSSHVRILGDHPLLSPAALAWFDRSVRRRDPEIVVLPTVVTAAVAVLRSTQYRRTQADIAIALEDILALSVRVEDRAVVAAAVELLRDRPSRDWEDCLIAAYAMAIADGHLAT